MSCNVAIVRGTCSSPPEVRLLESGRRLVTLQLTVRAEGRPTASVPVVAWDPPAWVETVEPGTEILAVGTVRRRFYRAAGATASKVEVEAEALAPTGNRRKLDTALRRVRAALEPLLG